MTTAHAAANWGSIALWAASAVLWFKAAAIKVPTLKGSMFEIGDKGGIGELSRQVNAQSRWNCASAITSGLGALALLIATLTAPAQPGF